MPMQERWLRSLGREDPLEKGVATHSRIRAWKMPRTEEPGGLQPTGPQSQTDERLRAAHECNSAHALAPSPRLTRPPPLPVR